MSVGKEGELFLVEAPTVGLRGNGPPPLTVSKFDTKTRKTDKLISGVAAFSLSDNGEKMLYKQGDDWFIAETSKAPEAGKES